MSREAFEESIRRAVGEVKGIEKVLESQRIEVKESEARLDRAHATVREKERDLREFLDAHKDDA